MVSLRELTSALCSRGAHPNNTLAELYGAISELLYGLYDEGRVNMLDCVYTTIAGAYCIEPCPHLGYSDPSI